jgi:hypothetical protein
MSILNKMSLALVCLLPSLAIANADSLAADTTKIPTNIHYTTVHTVLTPVLVDYNVYVGYQSGPHCLIAMAEPVIHDMLTLTMNDTRKSIDGEQLFKSVLNFSGYTCAEEVFTPYNSTGFYIVGFLLNGDNTGYHATNPTQQYVTISAQNP